MKKTNKGFTLVELIIVIAVIGVLAAILIPVFSNVIEKANIKSALSDARNALSIYVAEYTTGVNGGDCLPDGSVFVVSKAGKYLGVKYADNGLKTTDADIVWDTTVALAQAAGTATTYEASGKTATVLGETMDYVNANLPAGVIVYVNAD